MLLFCTSCNNLLSLVTTASDASYHCTECNLYIPLSDNDSLIHEEVSGDNLIVFRSILATAADDPVNPKVVKVCDKCGGDRARQIQLGSEMKLVNSCLTCRHQWLEV